MNRKTLIILGSCLLFGVTFVITLYISTQKIVHERNGFLRVYQKAAAIKANEMDIEFNSFYIAGVTEDHVYLGNVVAPFRMLVTNNTLTDSQHVKLHIKGPEKTVILKSADVKIDPPYFYLADGRTPVIFRGKLGEWEAEPFPYDSSAYFSQIAPIGMASFGIRTNQAQTLDNILGKVQRDSPQLQLKSGLLQKQVDGVFCTDGILQYNNELNRLVYTYYYRNEYVVYDTNLNLDYRGHTIDTFSRAQIKVGFVKSQNRNKLIDRKFVNQRSCTSGNYLFIKSNLLAKNDPEDRLERQSVIDVYDLTNNSYRFSFTLPNYNYDTETRLRDFKVFDNKTLIALYDHYMVKYDLQKRFF